jgi:hypothetical protein
MTTVSAESVAKITDFYVHEVPLSRQSVQNGHSWAEANIGRLSGRSIPATLNSLIGMRSYATHSDQGEANDFYAQTSHFAIKLILLTSYSEVKSATVLPGSAMELVDESASRRITPATELKRR